MKSERNKTLKVVDGFKFHFHKILKNDIHRWYCTVNTCKYFLKFNDNNICIHSFKDHTSHLKISEQIINRQKLNYSLKKKAVSDMFTRLYKIIHSELKNAAVGFLTTQDVKLIKRNYYL
jgi:hypothetical protein